MRVKLRWGKIATYIGSDSRIRPGVQPVVEEIRKLEIPPDEHICIY